MKAITRRSGVISKNVGYKFLVAELLRRKGVQQGNAAKIHFHAYLFRITFKGMKKKVSKKKANSTTTYQSINSNAPLTLFKMKRIQKPAVVQTLHKAPLIGSP